MSRVGFPQIALIEIWKGGEPCQTQREERGEDEDPSVLSDLVIHFHYASLTAFLYHSALGHIAADCALSNRHHLVTRQQAWQHIVDTPLLIDVSAFPSDAQLVNV